MVSCSSSVPRKATIKNVATAKSDLCQTGDVLVCFHYGLMAREKKDFKAAREYFKKGCEFHHPFSCSEQGLMERLAGDMSNYEELQDRACESMDSIACYNLACGYCIKNERKKTMNALRKASALGYSNALAAGQDPDLKCVHNSKDFKKWSSEIQKKKEEAFPISYDFSYLKGLDMSLRFPPSMTITRSFPSLFAYKDKAQISIFLSPDSYEDCLFKIKEKIKSKESIQDIKELGLKRNGLPVFIQRFNFISEKKELSEIIYVTGDSKRCWVFDGVTEKGIDKKIQDEVDMTVTSLVVKPFNQTVHSELNVYLESKKIKFAGISTATQGSGFYAHYSQNRMWPKEIDSTSIYLGLFVSQKLEDDPLFRQRLGDIALKVIPYGYNYSEFLDSGLKEYDGKMAIFYKTKVVKKNREIIVTTVFYQLSDTKLPVMMVHYQPNGKKEILNWESALKGIIQK